MKKSDLKYLINECIQEVLNEEQERKAILAELENLSLEELKELHEGFFGQAKTTLKRAFGAGSKEDEAKAKVDYTEAIKLAISKGVSYPEPGTPEFEKAWEERALPTAKSNSFEGKFEYDSARKKVVYSAKEGLPSAGAGGGTMIGGSK